MKTMRLAELFEPGKPKPLVIFDLDETLVDTFPGLSHECYVWACREAGIAYEEAERILKEGYLKEGIGIYALCRKMGWPLKETKLRFVKEATDAFLEKLDEHVQPEPSTIQKMHILEGRSATLGVFTANIRSYALKVLSQSSLMPCFQPKFVAGNTCVNGLSKMEIEAYTKYLQRMRHLPADTPRIMIEDSAPNLPAAKQAGIYTVHIGPKDYADHVDSIDFRFDTLHDVLDEMNGERA